MNSLLYRQNTHTQACLSITACRLIRSMPCLSLRLLASCSPPIKSSSVLGARPHPNRARYDDSMYIQHVGHTKNRLVDHYEPSCEAPISHPANSAARLIGWSWNELHGSRAVPGRPHFGRALFWSARVEPAMRQVSRIESWIFTGCIDDYWRLNPQDRLAMCWTNLSQCQRSRHHSCQDCATGNYHQPSALAGSFLHGGDRICRHYKIEQIKKDHQIPFPLPMERSMLNVPKLNPDHGAISKRAIDCC